MLSGVISYYKQGIFGLSALLAQVLFIEGVLDQRRGMARIPEKMISGE